MSKWPGLLEQHRAGRSTSTLLEQGLFSDVDVLVQGRTFHCHRYVLAQHSQYFFSKLVTLQTLSPEQTQDSLVVSEQPAIPSCISDDDVLSGDGGYRSNVEVDSCKLQQEELLEALGKPAVIGSLEEPAEGNQFFKSEPTAFENIGKKSSGTHSSGIRHLSVEKYQQTSLLKKEKQCQQRLALKVNFLTPDTFRSVIEAIYYGRDTVTTTNALTLYKASNQLQIPSLVEHCEEFIIQLLRNRTLHAATILYDYLMANNSSIVQTALEMLLTDFGPDSSKGDWFLKLPAEKLFSVLTDPRLNVRNEDEVYRALMDWYGHDPCVRGQHVATALTMLRLANLDKRILVEEILTHPLCSGGFQTLPAGSGNRDGNDVNLAGKLVRQALAYHLLPDRRHDELLAIADFRPSQDWERVLLVLGDQSAQLYAFSFARRAWFRLAPPPKALGLGVTACTHDDDLYVTGGDTAMTGCYRYRAEVNGWTQMANLKVGRRSHGCVALDNRLYVLGGKDDKQSPKKDTLDSIEVFHVKNKAAGWQLLAKSPLVVPVRSMTCLPCGEKIYVLGGRTNGIQHTVDAIQCFDTKTQQCSLVGHLPSPSCLSRSFLVNKVAYILETNGDISSFHPHNLHHTPVRVDPPAAGPPTKASQHEKSYTYSTQSLLRSGKKQDAGEEEERVQSVWNDGEPAITKVGRVMDLDWKWFGAARSHDGTLYVVAGERPRAALRTPSLSVWSVDSDGEVLGQVRFICPGSMSMCYVSSHMCIPKSFLVEKLVCV